MEGDTQNTWENKDCSRYLKFWNKFFVTYKPIIRVGVVFRYGAFGCS